MKYFPGIKMLLAISLLLQMNNLSQTVTATAKETANNKEQHFVQQQKPLRKQALFQYQREGKSDPFMPFLNQQRPAPEPVPARIRMQNFKLVGVITVGQEKIAIAEDASGKGYYWIRGARIGNSIESVELKKTG